MFKFKLPTKEEVVKMWPLSYMADHLTSPGMWVFRRHTVSLAVAWGLFCACLPIPFQMIVATVGCVVWRINLPLSLALVWVTNPVTIPLLAYIAFTIGNALMPSEAVLSMDDFSSLDAIYSLAESVLPQFLLGCLVMGISLSSTGYLATQLLWGFWSRQRWLKLTELRKLRHKLHLDQGQGDGGGGGAAGKEPSANERQGESGDSADRAGH